MISKTAEYALRAIVFLGNEGVPRTTSKISETIKAPPSYLSKVMQRLCQHGIVDSQRGLHGGFTIKKPLAELTILDVVNAVDPIQRILECPLGNLAHGTDLCPLHRCMDEALERAEKTFSNITVDSLLEEPRLELSCRFPASSNARDPVDRSEA